MSKAEHQFNRTELIEIIRMFSSKAIQKSIGTMAGPRGAKIVTKAEKQLDVLLTSLIKEQRKKNPSWNYTENLDKLTKTGS